jgi:oligopeptide/dipeptide ABC transporter ATP-binding protein
MTADNSFLVAAKGLQKSYRQRGSGFLAAGGRIRAVAGVDLEVGPGEIVGLVGESGCGKSTLGRLLLRLEHPDAGRIFYRETDLSAPDEKALRPYRRHLQIIFQDPYSSLNPRMRIGKIIEEPLVIHRLGEAAARRQRVRELLEIVGLDPGVANRYPHEFSGGQRQRIGIARALSLQPEFVVADEPVSALDVSVQAQILNLLLDWRQQFRLAMLFISHDLSVVKMVSDRVLVMYLGSIIEEAPGDELYKRPLHPYSRLLLQSIPLPDPRRRRQRPPGGVPDGGESGNAGCVFYPRCPEKREICRRQPPALVRQGGGRRVACHLYQDETI